MSKSKQYRKKRESKGNIFVILIVLLVVLIIVAIVGTSIDNSKYNGLLKDYAEFTYGERENVKLQRVTGLGTEAFANENYAYYVDSDIIYDNNKNLEAIEKFNTKVDEIANILGTVNQKSFAKYTDGTDFSVDYDYMIIDAVAAEVLGSEDVAAEKIMEFITALGEDYNVCGMVIAISDGEYYYTSSADVMQKKTVTIEMIKENLTATELTVEEAPAESDAEGEAETEAEAEEGETEEAPAEDAE